MVRKTALVIAVLLGSTVTTAVAAPAPPLTGAQLQSQAKLSLKAAQAKALAKEHGTIVAQELEREKGGSGLRYSFDVKVGSTLHEVGIDAATGAVLEDSIDNGKD